MILETQTTTVVSNLSAEVETFTGTISEEDFEFLMPVLSNLYNDPKAAVVREMSTNARDSHVEAGNTDPVLITLPTYDTKTFVVQDFGIGMSVDDIKNVYSHYARSTKRNSNKQVGAFGLGCKSPLAIATQFTLVTVKDGVKANVLIQRDPSRGLKAMIVSKVDTDEPNGVTVSIPVSGSISDFIRTAQSFYRFSEPGMYLVDGTAPVSAYEGATEMRDAYGELVGYIKTDYNDTSYVVMGGVPYELTSHEIRNAGNRLDLDFGWNTFATSAKYIPVEIGSVDLTPNREGLRFTDRTTASVDAALKAMYEGLRVTAQAEIDEVMDRASVGPIVERWKRFGISDLKWDGEAIESTVRLTGQYSSIDRRNGRDASSHGQGRVIDVFRKDQVIVTGNPFDKYKRISGYLTDYGRATGMKRKLFIFLEHEEALDSPRITENSNFEFTTFQSIIDATKEYRKEQRAILKAMGMPPGRERGPRQTGKATYRVLDVETGVVETKPYDEVPSGIVYLAAKDVYGPGRSLRELAQTMGRASSTITQRIKDALPDLKEILLLEGTKSEDALLKRVKGAKNISTLLDELSTSYRDSLTDEKRSILSSAQYSSSYSAAVKLVGAVSSAEALDPRITELGEKVAEANRVLEEKRVYEAFASYFRIGSTTVPVVGYSDYEVSGLTERPIDIDALLKDYPLLKVTMDQYSYRSQIPEDLATHLVAYVNTVYSTLVNADES